MKKEHFQYTIKTSKAAREVFELLLDVGNWWSGLYEETIKGKSKKINDEFSFTAASGAHYTKQKLVELIPDKKVTWQVTDSKLKFLQDPSEWKNTKISFELSSDKNKTEVQFTHEGLVPEMEGYEGCSNAWKDYMDAFEKKLK